MSYEKFKAKRNEIESEIIEKELRTKHILSPEDFDYLLYLIDEYSELTRQMLKFIKSKEKESDRECIADFFKLDK